MKPEEVIKAIKPFVLGWISTTSGGSGPYAPTPHDISGVHHTGGIGGAHTLYVDEAGKWGYSSIQAAVNAASDGDIIFIATGIYTGDITLYPKQYISLIGEGEGEYDGVTGFLIGGTIIRGKVDLFGSIGSSLANIGVDQHTNNYGCVDTGFLTIYEQLALYQRFNNLTLVGNPSVDYDVNTCHEFRCQGGAHISLDNIKCYHGAHGIAIRGSWANISNVYAQDCLYSAIIVKAIESTGDAEHVNISNFLSHNTLPTSTGGIVIQSYDAVSKCRYVNVNNAVIERTSGSAVVVEAVYEGGVCSHVNIANVIDIENKYWRPFWTYNADYVTFESCQCIDPEIATTAITVTGGSHVKQIGCSVHPSTIILMTGDSTTEDSILQSNTNQYGANEIIEGKENSRTPGKGATLGFIVPTRTDGTIPWQHGRIMVTPDNATDARAEGRMYIQTRAGYSGGVWPWNDGLIMDSLGNVGAGLMPTAVLHLKAGTAVAASAPLKFTSGVLLSTPEVGAIEFVNDTLSLTITTAAARKTLAFTDSPISSSMFIGTTEVALNRASAPLTLAGITLTTPVIGAATGTSLKLVSDGDKITLFEDDVAEANAFIKLTNNITTAELLGGRLHMKSNRTTYGNDIIADLFTDAAEDTGAALTISARLNNGAALANRPLLNFYNYTTLVATILPNRYLGIGTKVTPYSWLDVNSPDGGILTLSRNDAYVAANEVIGQVNFWTNDAQGSSNPLAAQIKVTALANITDYTNAGIMDILVTGTAQNGALIECMSFQATTVPQIGAYGADVTARPAAYTQTAYSTTTRIVNAITAVDPAAYVTGAYGYSTAAIAAAVHAECIALKVDMANVKSVLNQVIDDLQLIGWLA
jgi:hypothetical protein